MLAAMSDPSPMTLALAEAEAAAARGEVPIGAVLLAPDGTLLARAGNRVEALADPTAHAEILALREGGRLLGRPRLVDCDLYVTLEPCPMCAQAISFARIRRLYYGAADPKGGGVDHGPRIFAGSSCHHVPEVYGGIGEREAAALLRAFFAARRTPGPTRGPQGP
jgi:tRNA(adenine34) deaminase